jgi:hypothetical protein
MSVHDEIHQRVTALRKRDSRLTELEAEAQVLNHDHDLYERYRRAPQATIPGAPETRLMPADSAAEQEAFTRAEGLVAKASGALTMNDALARVFRDDPELYRRYTVGKQTDFGAELLSRQLDLYDHCALTAMAVTKGRRSLRRSTISRPLC